MREAYEAGDSIELIAHRYKRAFSTVHDRLHRVTRLRTRSEAARSFSPQQEQRIIKLMGKPGAKRAQVAKEVGVSPYVVRRIMVRNAAPPPLRVLKMKARRKIREQDPTHIHGRPLATFINREIVKRNGRTWWDGALAMRTRVCDDCGIGIRILYAWEQGSVETTRFDTADRVLIGLGLLWWEVFDPQEHPACMLRSRQRDDVLAWLDVVDRASRLWTGEVLLGPDDPVLEAERVAALEWAA